MKATRRLALAVVVALLGVAGCRTAVPVERTVTDGAGRVVTLPAASPSRIVSMAPACTEILFALGLGDRLVGVTTWCDYPEEARSLTKVGDAWSPDYERIVGLKPDVVLAAGTAESEIVLRLQAYDIPVVVVNAATVDEVPAQVELVGEVTGRIEQARELAASMRSRLQEVRRRVAEIPVTARPTVFWVLDDLLWTVGPGSFVHDLLESSGGRNVAEALGVPYAQYSLEALLEKNPDVIVLAALDPTLGPGLEALPGWSNLRAVREGRVYRVDADLVSRPGPRVVDGVELVARLLHPQVFR